MTATAIRYLDTLPSAEAALIPPAVNSPVEKRIRKALGMTMAALPTVSWTPWLADAAVRFGPAFRTSLSPQLAGLIALVVSQDNACRHCYGLTRSLLRIQGMTEGTIRQLEADLHTAPLSEREQAALEFARRVSRAAPRVGPEDLEHLRAAGYTAAEAVEITFVAATSVFSNRMMTLLAIQPEIIERFEGGAFGWLLRPVMRFVMARKKFHYPADPVPPGTTTSVDALFAALEGVPGRDDLRRMVVDAQQSTVTTPRQKALIMAVIAAGLDCHLCTRGSRDILRREGIPEPEVDAMVTHLTSERLEPFEISLMHFARETVRYRPELIHQKCTAFFKGLPPELAVEVVGLCALANLLGRLSVLLPW